MPARAVPTSVVLVALSVMLLVGGPLGLGRDALKGTWSATITPDDGTSGKEHADTLTFTNGFKFSSDVLAKQGFEAASYDDRPAPLGAAATFEVTLKNKAGDTAHWQGTATAGEMTGTLVVTLKDAAPASYTFKADRK